MSEVFIKNKSVTVFGCPRAHEVSACGEVKQQCVKRDTRGMSGVQSLRRLEKVENNGTRDGEGSQVHSAVSSWNHLIASAPVNRLKSITKRLVGLAQCPLYLPISPPFPRTESLSFVRSSRLRILTRQYGSFHRPVNTISKCTIHPPRRFPSASSHKSGNEHPGRETPFRFCNTNLSVIKLLILQSH